MPSMKKLPYTIVMRHPVVTLPIFSGNGAKYFFVGLWPYFNDTIDP